MDQRIADGIELLVSQKKLGFCVLFCHIGKSVFWVICSESSQLRSGIRLRGNEDVCFLLKKKINPRVKRQRILQSEVVLEN